MTNRPVTMGFGLQMDLQMGIRMGLKAFYGR